MGSEGRNRRLGWLEPEKFDARRCRRTAGAPAISDRLDSKAEQLCHRHVIRIEVGQQQPEPVCSPNVKQIMGCDRARGQGYFEATRPQGRTADRPRTSL
jgi:hypothetical protein